MKVGRPDAGTGVAAVPWLSHAGRGPERAFAPKSLAIAARPANKHHFSELSRNDLPTEYHHSKSSNPILVVQQGGAQCISPQGEAFLIDRNRLIPFGVIALRLDPHLTFSRGLLCQMVEGEGEIRC